MLSLANLTAIVWVAGGITITLALLIGLAFWIAQERPAPGPPQPGPPQPGPPPAEPGQHASDEQPPEQDRPASGQRDD